MERRNDVSACSAKWRREGDSNPRYDFKSYTGLANQRLQPLGHLSRLPASNADPQLSTGPIKGQGHRQSGLGTRIKGQGQSLSC